MATLALLCEAANWNAARAPNPIPHQGRGRGRELSTLLDDHPYIPSRAIGMGRVRNRSTGSHPFPDPSLQVPNMWPHCLCPQGRFPNPPLGPNPPLPEAPSGPPPLESITSSESLGSGYEVDSD